MKALEVYWAFDKLPQCPTAPGDPAEYKPDRLVSGLRRDRFVLRDYQGGDRHLILARPSRRPARPRELDHVLQRTAPAFRARLPDFGRDPSCLAGAHGNGSIGQECVHDRLHSMTLADTGPIPPEYSDGRGFRARGRAARDHQGAVGEAVAAVRTAIPHPCPSDPVGGWQGSCQAEAEPGPATNRAVPGSVRGFGLAAGQIGPRGLRRPRVRERNPARLT